MTSRHRRSPVLSVRALVEIDFDPSKFDIRDDCGGISNADATEQVFLLGNPVKDKSNMGLGVYGIGMKRAFFKIGKQISITSHTTEERFKIDINVEEWQKDAGDWTFPFTYAELAKSRKGGTRIAITKLHPTVGEQFALKAFKTLLVDKSSKAYALFVKAGATIRVNGIDARADIPALAESKDLRAVRHMMRKDGVDILIMAGLSPANDRTPRGWYVFCNGRMVLDADKSPKTGWGADSHPAFHAKFNHFLGYIYFRSKDVEKLPWTTTKEDVDVGSPIYQTALAEVRLLSRPILDFLSNLYSDVKEQSEPEHTLFAQAKPVDLGRIASRPNTVFKATVRRQTDDDLVSVQYKRPMNKLKRIKEVIGRWRMSAASVGEYTFDWFYDRNCK